MNNFKTKIAVCLLLFFGAASCAKDPQTYGKISHYNTNNKNSFIFSVDEEYLRKNQNSKKDKNYPKMTEAEVDLLQRLFAAENYCMNDDKKVAFTITSRQEKIYDITFSHLIEQNYNAKPISPRMYFGECR